MVFFHTSNCKYVSSLYSYRARTIYVNFDLRRIKGQTSLLRSTRKVNKIVTVISRQVLTARAIDVTNFPLNR